MFKARLMFDGEFEGLGAIAATNTVVVPKPIKVLDNPDGGACLVTSHMDMKMLNKHSAELGDRMARLHLHNKVLRDANDPRHLTTFGFHKTTFHRLTPQDNTWKNDWVTFFIQNRLEPLFSIVEEKNDVEAIQLWLRLKEKIPSFFEGIEVNPSIVHGDFWGGNVGETSTHPVIFDLASVFYGHHEYDVAVSVLWGGFTSIFYDAYHKMIPKSPRFKERQKLYQLHQFLHHWIFMKDLYRKQVIAIMKNVLQKSS
ncbi:ketosamine-3-kinase-like [Macrosteles quadrilineatus]|uniref:ketosamine-3-kinase-like n=1 Tax=Macrosteles quadrilineatus TaxID=74068 RepID=UPI0023E1A889|nr:ketosamine-3-kinase-like [Macrosteles quadrilineatus]